MLIASGHVLQQRYQVARLIGQGGMGAVYEATHLQLGSQVALKQFAIQSNLDAVTEQRLRHAFQREAKLLFTLRHPVLPRVHDQFEDPAGMFLAMEYIPGSDLEGMCKEHNAPFPVSQVLEWADQLLDALIYLHTHQPPILHRDIKPQNLKLTAEGALILLDFGLAKGSPAMQSVTTSLISVMGYTPHYAPLEQIQGAGTDERSDLYAVGATLYRLLTNTIPPDALTRGTTVLQGQPDVLQPPSSFNPLIPAALDHLLLQTLSLQRHARPASATALRTSLRAVASQPASLPTVSQPLPPPPPSRQTPDTPPAWAGQTPAADTTTAIAAPVSRRRAWWPWGALVLVGMLLAGALALGRSAIIMPWSEEVGVGETATVASQVPTASPLPSPPVIVPTETPTTSPLLSPTTTVTFTETPTASPASPTAAPPLQPPTTTPPLPPTTVTLPPPATTPPLPPTTVTLPPPATTPPLPPPTTITVPTYPPIATILPATSPPLAQPFINAPTQQPAPTVMPTPANTSMLMPPAISLSSKATYPQGRHR